MEQQQKQQPPSPELIFNLMNAFSQSDVLKGALELEFFTAIAEGNSTVEAIAKRCKASPRGIRILADYLTVTGLLTKNDGKYGLTADSAMFLDKNKPSYLGTAVRFLMAPEMRKGFEDIAAVVRKGGTVTLQDGTISEENPIWVEFAKGMMPLMMPPAMAIPEIIGAAHSAKWRVLDIAAGHGIFGIMLATRNPNAEIVALDWPAVLNVAEENARKFGVIDRWKKLPGDATGIDFGAGYDIVLMTNFLHHFDVPTCEKILKKAHAALNRGGRVVTLEFVPNEDRVSPPIPAKFSMIMLAGTPAGDAYTFGELDRMFKNAGFSRSERHDLPGYPGTIIVSHAQG
jgi:2-polyprenyl-3-methyl-5-hydroxy-6-metoxy-1,4-benzoquinol methylase